MVKFLKHLFNLRNIRRSQKVTIDFSRVKKIGQIYRDIYGNLVFEGWETLGPAMFYKPSDFPVENPATKQGDGLGPENIDTAISQGGKGVYSFSEMRDLANPPGKRRLCVGCELLAKEESRRGSK